MVRQLCILIISLLFLPLANGNTRFDQALLDLTQQSFKIKATAVDIISTSQHEKSQLLLQTLLAGDLYYNKNSKQLVTILDSDDELEEVTTKSLLSGEESNGLSDSIIKKVKINNQMRIRIKAALAQFELKHDDPQVRLNAVRNMTKNSNSNIIQDLKAHLSDETDSNIIALIEETLALSVLRFGNEKEQLEAIESLSHTSNVKAKTLLNQIINTAGTEHYSTTIIAASRNAIKRINDTEKLNKSVETLFFGISLGSVLLLSAIGLAITFGVMGVINMAHGELMMLGAYTTYVVQLLMPNTIDYSLFVAIPAAFVVAGITGILIERGVIRFLYGRPLETLLATFGISLILQQLVRSIFSPLNRSVETPSWMSGSIQINEMLSLTYNRLYIIVFALLVFAALIYVMKKTRLGLQVRAVTQNREMARAMGIRSGYVDALTFGLGSGIAGVAGVALSQLTNVGPNLGQAYIIDSFMVVVFGGVGNLWGTLVAAMSLGVINKFLEPWSGAVLAKILVLVFIILFIQKKPRGLFPQKGRAAEG